MPKYSMNMSESVSWNIYVSQNYDCDLLINNMNKSDILVKIQYNLRVIKIEPHLEETNTGKC